MVFSAGLVLPSRDDRESLAGRMVSLHHALYPAFPGLQSIAANMSSIGELLPDTPNSYLVHFSSGRAWRSQFGLVSAMLLKLSSGLLDLPQ